MSLTQHIGYNIELAWIQRSSSQQNIKWKAEKEDKQKIISALITAKDNKVIWRRKEKKFTHGKTPTRFPANPEYRPFKTIFPPSRATWYRME